MDIVGNTKFVELPGTKTHELPPLLIRSSPNVKRLDRVVDMAAGIVDSEDMLPSQRFDDPAMDLDLQRRRMDLAIHMVDQYLGFVRHWQWGDSVLEWIRQCEITFETRSDLRSLLCADLWPHAGRVSFIRLLRDKSVPTQGVGLEKAIGLRLNFRQPPAIRCLSEQFLLYLNNDVASSSYQSWANLSPDPVAAFPPERFSFDVVNMSLE